MTIENVPPAAPVAPWLGGKSKLAKTIIDRIERIPHRAYVEPFVGMGGVFLRRPFRPKLEVANDLNGEIINLFRILQRHYPQLMEVMRFQITSRREFERLRASSPETLTDLERAARFLYLQKLSFGGKPDGVFGVVKEGASRFSIARLGPLLDAAHERLDGVVFECLPWEEVVDRYDSPHTLFYLDPPYWGGEGDYGSGMFDSGSFVRMASKLAAIEGKFIMSINDVPEIRDTFAGFKMDDVRLKYTVSRGDAKKVGELLISNTAAPAGLL